MENTFIPVIGKAHQAKEQRDDVVKIVHTQESFDELFVLIFHHEKVLAVHAAEAIHKIALTHKEFLQSHKQQLIALLTGAIHKELKRHIIKLVPSVDVDAEEMKEIWQTLLYWAQNPNESALTRVSALQALYTMSLHFPVMQQEFIAVLQMLKQEPVQSVKTKVEKLMKLTLKD